MDKRGGNYSIKYQRNDTESGGFEALDQKVWNLPLLISPAGGEFDKAEEKAGAIGKVKDGENKGEKQVIVNRKC